jgi:uracil-DNA glycosylase
MKSELFEGISEEWKSILNIPELDEVITKLQEDVAQYSPHPSKFFEFARLTPLDQIRVIILGMDPYPTPNNAHGLAFSCLNTIPAALKNIYKAIEKSGFILTKPYTGNLTNWAKQGILLINVALSTKIGHSGSHIDIWKPYTNQILKHFTNNANIIFALWGNPAHKYENIIVKSNLVLKWRHPSPLAQSCANELKFVNCPHFRLINEKLQELNLPQINWDPNWDPIIENQISSPTLKSPFNYLCDNFFECSPNKHIVFTDGGCYPNDKSKNSKGGYSAIWVCGPLAKMQIYGSLKTHIPPSNIRAEGMAIIRVLKQLNLPENTSNWTHCTIILDCKFWLDMLYNYMPKWYKSKKFDTQANPDITKTMWNLYRKLIKNNKSITLIHMKSHNKSGWKSYAKGTKERFMYEMNQLADQLATKGRLECEPGSYTILS